MTRLQETERAYLVAKMKYQAVLLKDIEGRQPSHEACEAHSNTYNQRRATEKRLLRLNEEIEATQCPPN